MATKGKPEPEFQADESNELDEMFSADDGSGSEDDDLLDEIVEDDSEGWVPEKAGDAVAGLVLKVGETHSDFSEDTVPVVTIQTKDGAKLRIIGYGAVLRREILDANPKVGDRFGVKYFGEKPIKKGKFQGRPYKHFNVAVRRARTESDG